MKELRCAQEGCGNWSQHGYVCGVGNMDLCAKHATEIEVLKAARRPVVEFFVPGPLPGMNEIIAAAKSGRGRGNGYARLKAQWTSSVALLAKVAMRGRRGPMPVGAWLLFYWVEKDRRRDPDNFCAGGRKLVLDGLVKAGAIHGDGWSGVCGWRDKWDVSQGGDDRPGVWVSIYDRDPWT